MGEIFITIPEKAFDGLSVMTVADLLQLPAFREKILLWQFPEKYSTKHLSGLQIWHLFEYTELTEFVGQNDILFIDFHKADDNVEELLKSKFILESDENYPKDALNMNTEMKLLQKGMKLL